MYMGELIRQVLVDLMKDDLIFVGADREKILERGSFYTRYASEIESDPVGEYTRAKQALEEMGIDPEEVTDDDCSALRSDNTVHAAVLRIRNGDPGSGAFLTPGSGIQNGFFPDPGSRIPDPKPILLRA
jgi:hypothetical protein